jgi:voltage-gated potassium channel Kch
MTAFYFTITTITTVGFGDISAGTEWEKLFAVIVMLAGVIGFSFATGSLSSIMNNLDSANAKLKEKLNTLESIKRDYSIGQGLYEEL